VDSFKGFQQEPEEPFRLREKSDPETGRSVDPAEVGGLHQLIFSSVDFRRRRQQVKEETE
jgi:hypothetical protein